MKRVISRNLDISDRASLMVNETLFSSANGYIGVRGAFEEGYAEGEKTVRGSYLNGVYEIIDMPQAEALYGLQTEKQTILNIAEVQSIRMYIDDELITPTGAYERYLDMASGITGRKFTASTKWGNVTVETERMASFLRPGIFIIRIRVQNDTGKTIRVRTAHHANVRNFSDSSDPRVASESPDHLEHHPPVFDGDCSFVHSVTKRSRIRTATAVSEKIGFHLPDTRIENNAAIRSYEMEDSTFEITRIVSFSDSRLTQDPLTDAGKNLVKARDAGLEILFSEQKEYLESFWNDLGFALDGDDELEEALCFNLYELLSSVGKDGRSHLAAKGLSGEGYEGHYFWDTEMYVQPIFTLLRPEISRSLLEYRYSIMDKARHNAEILGHEKGVLFPWRSINGDECSGFFPAGTAQYHINGAVAHAIIEYYEITGDNDFMRTKGLEMLLEISRLWIDLGVFTDRGFEIHSVTGPDEYTCCVSNNYYTNTTAKYDLEKTAELLRRFHFSVFEEELEEFERAAREMYLPHDDKLDIDAQDDTFLHKKKLDLDSIPEDKHPMLMHYHPLFLYRHQICKQADVTLSHMLYPEYSKKSTMLNSLLYYEKVTTHDSSLSKSIFGIVSSMLGMKDKALEYFSSSADIDLKDAQGNTKDGIHSANMGGSYLAIIRGFAGLKVNEKGIFLSPDLPDAWMSLSFSFFYRGTHISLKIGHGEIEAASSSPVIINVAGTDRTIDEEKVRILL